MPDKNQTKLITQLLCLSETTQHKKKVFQHLKKTHTHIKTIDQTNLTWINENQESIKIQTIRELINQSNYASTHDEIIYFILLHAELASRPAQNALLKIIEEPPSNKQFILTSHRLNLLLPTIQSRCQILYITNKKHYNNHNLFKNWILDLQLLFKHPQKIKYSEIIKQADKFKDRVEAQKHLNELLVFLHQDLNNHTDLGKLFTIKQINLALDRLEKNINVKLTLEDCFFNIKQHLIKISEN